ncbi:hypothetical protein HGRIS_000847 [Hohenbuehelia grisea]|uniref:Uncharacterized protein n=1 Tax=Hohenbuehelia grisea TaxID=104357 RepID=A0ABR3IPY7_9AGAR
MQSIPHSEPSVDATNPLYCPTVSATSYLSSLRYRIVRKASAISNTTQGVRRNHRLNYRFLFAFARISKQAPVVPRRSQRGGNASRAEDSGPLSDNPAPGLDLENLEDDEDSTSTICGESPDRNQSQISPRFLPPQSSNEKRKRSDSFSDLRGPPKYAKSLQSVHDSSFEVGITRETLDFSPPYHSIAPNSQDIPIGAHISRRPAKSRLPSAWDSDSKQSVGWLKSRIRDLEEEFYGTPAGTESPRGIKAFIATLDELIPGIRLKDRLLELDNPTHQRIATLLGMHGLLCPKILSFLRTTEIESLVLTNSLRTENGLNLLGDDILPVFGKPNSFLFLSQLSLAGARIRDSDLSYIHHLPRIAVLSLGDTDIGNEGVFLLVNLKRSLTHLSLANNPSIDDDAIPALLLLSKLVFLSVFETSVGMPGLRRLSSAILAADRSFTLECPAKCEKYLIRLHVQYLINPLPPLITNPDAASQLSMSALKRNLAAHAACNPDISVSGSKIEMSERLRHVLQIREADLMVREVVFGSGDSEEDEL